MRQNTLISNILLQKLTDYDASRLNTELLNEFSWLQEIHISATAEQSASTLTILMTRKDKTLNFFSAESELRKSILKKFHITSDDIEIIDYDVAIDAIKHPSTSIVRQIYQEVLWCKIPLAEFTYRTLEEFNAKLNDNLAANQQVVDTTLEDRKDSEVQILKDHLVMALTKLPSIERQKIKNSLSLNEISIDQTNSLEVL